MYVLCVCLFVCSMTSPPHPTFAISFCFTYFKLAWVYRYFHTHTHTLIPPSESIAELQTKQIEMIWQRLQVVSKQRTVRNPCECSLEISGGILRSSRPSPDAGLMRGGTERRC